MEAMTALIAAVREAQKGAPRLPVRHVHGEANDLRDANGVRLAIPVDDEIAAFLATAANAVGPLCDFVERVASLNDRAIPRSGTELHEIIAEARRLTGREP